MTSPSGSRSSAYRHRGDPAADHRLPPVWQPDPLPGRPPGVPLPGAVPRQFTVAHPVPLATPVGPFAPSDPDESVITPFEPVDIPAAVPPVDEPAATAAPTPTPAPATPQWPGQHPAPWSPPLPGTGGSAAGTGTGRRRRRRPVLLVVGTALIVAAVVLAIVAAVTGGSGTGGSRTRGSGPTAGGPSGRSGPVAPAETALVVTMTNLRTGASVVNPVDMATGTVSRPIPVPRFADAIEASAGAAYVLASGASRTGPGSVTAIHLDTETAAQPIPIPGAPVAMAITADGATAYVVSIDETTTTLVP